MTNPPIQLNDSLKHTLTLPLRLQIAALSEGLQIGQLSECQHFALRLIEIAGLGQLGITQQSLSPAKLITSLSTRWQARHAEAALLALAMGWTKLSPELRKLAVALGRARWITTTKSLAQDPDPTTRLSALAIAANTVDPGLGVMVCSMLSDEHSKVRLAADKALIALTLDLFPHLSADMLGEDFDTIRNQPRTRMLADPAVLELERCAMLSAIADAAWSFSTHRCRSPLLASLLLMDRQGATQIEHRAFDKMRRLLSERNHPSHMPMRTVLRTTPAPILRERALRWLIISPIAGVASARLQTTESIPEHRAVLDQMHLCLRPLRASALKKVRIPTTQTDGSISLEPRAPMLSPEDFAALNPDTKRGYLRWVTLLDLDPTIRRAQLEQAMADPSPDVRLHACCVADSLDLPDFLYDPNDSIAQHAAIRWSTTGNTPPATNTPSWKRRMSTAHLNSRSPSQWVRRIANEELERLSMELPNSPSSRLQARRLYQSDPAQFVRSIRQLLHQPAQRDAALGIILALSLETRFEMDLLALTHEPALDSRTNASLVRALSALDTRQAKHAVLQSLESDDQRVVANAIESIHTPLASLIEYKADPNHRVRSSALRRMLLSSTESNLISAAADDLGDMLCDQRTPHRLAAVWAAQRIFEPNTRKRLTTNWRDLVTTLNDMTINEPDDAVRTRADQCVHRLLVTQRTQTQQATTS